MLCLPLVLASPMLGAIVQQESRADVEEDVTLVTRLPCCLGDLVSLSQESTTPCTPSAHPTITDKGHIHRLGRGDLHIVTSLWMFLLLDYIFIG